MRLIVLVVLLPYLGFAQQTYVPNDNFEMYLETHAANGNPYPLGSPYTMGNGIANDDYVPTSKISGVTTLDLSFMAISDLTGIEDFAALNSLSCLGGTLSSLNVTQNTALTDLTVSGCQLTSLDVTQNPNLTYLHCWSNQLSSLNVSQNPSLLMLECGENNITTLDVSNNVALKTFHCTTNLITELDVSQNPALEYFGCVGNNLTCLNVKNGNNIGMLVFEATNNPNLTCIEVDDAAWATANWTIIDPTASFSQNCANNCSSPSVELNELYATPKQLVRIVDLMGREVQYERNTVLIYEYSDGSTERVYHIE